MYGIMVSAEYPLYSPSLPSAHDGANGSGTTDTGWREKYFLLILP